MLRTQARDNKVYYHDVRHDRNQRDCCLQFFGAFRYNHKEPCYVYFHETQEEKEIAEKLLALENAATQALSNHAQTRARAALQKLRELDINLQATTRKLQHIKKHNYYRGIRLRGSVDRYRHREGALKKVAL